MFEVEQNAKHKNPKVRASAAASPHASAKVLDRLAVDDTDEVREWVARNQNVTLMTLWDLAEDENPRVRAFAAWNPVASKLMLHFLIDNDDVPVVRKIAQVALDSRS